MKEKVLGRPSLTHKFKWLAVLFVLVVIIPSQNGKSAVADSDSTIYRLAFQPTPVLCQMDQGLCLSFIDTIKVDGSDRHPLLGGFYLIISMKASPDRKQILFVSPLNGPRDILVADVSTGKVTQITNMDDMSIGGSDWSPDGKNIVFGAAPAPSASTTFRSQLYVVASDGSSLLRLTNNDADDSYPRWSPDGKQIAFTSYRDGNGALYIMNLDGTDQRYLGPENPSYTPLAEWSPDSQYILMELYDTVSMLEVATGREYHFSDNSSIFWPTFSPDGQKIAFFSGWDGSYEIYAMNLDGTHQQRLTVNNAKDIYPQWSPDGKYIAFISDRDGRDELYVMNADGTNPTQLTYDGCDGLFVWIAGD